MQVSGRENAERSRALPRRNASIRSSPSKGLEVSEGLRRGSAGLPSIRACLPALEGAPTKDRANLRRVDATPTNILSSRRENRRRRRSIRFFLRCCHGEAQKIH